MASNNEPNDEMVPMFGVPITGDGPTTLADLESVAFDLRFAERVLARVADVDPESDPDLRRALYDAGTIAYRRGFNSGRALLVKRGSRTKVPADILNALDDSSRVVHERLLTHASQHVAHGVNDLEQARVLVLLNNPTLGKAVQGVGGLKLRFVGPRPEDAKQSARTAGLIAARIERYVEAYRSALLADAQAKDIDELYENAGPLDGAT